MHYIFFRPHMNMAWFACGLPCTVITNTEERNRTAVVTKIVFEAPFEHITIGVERRHVFNCKGFSIYKRELVVPVERARIVFRNSDLGRARWA